MNKERLLKLAEVIEQNPDEFSIGDWWSGAEELPIHFDFTPYQKQYPDVPLWRMQTVIDNLKMMEQTTMCGTQACFAGWAVFLWASEIDIRLYYSENARVILDLTASQAEFLFYDFSDQSRDAQSAAALLRRFVEVDGDINRI